MNINTVLTNGGNEHDAKPNKQGNLVSYSVWTQN